MSPAVAWDQGTALVAARCAEAALPRSLRAGRARLEVTPLPVIPRARRAADRVRRYPAAWTDGCSGGHGYVEVRPAASYAVEVVLHLRAPGGVRGLLWPRRRLVATTQRLLTALLASLREAVAPDAERGGHVEAGGRPSARPALGEPA